MKGGAVVGFMVIVIILALTVLFFLFAPLALLDIIGRIC